MVSATGRVKSRVPAAWRRIVSGSCTSASTYAVAPAGLLVSSARACTSTMGSLST